MGQFNLNFHQAKGGRKICIFGPGHITKMAAMSVYGKNLKISSLPEPPGRLL